MRFLVDAQLPRRLAFWLMESGHDALHTLDLPAANLTKDRDLIARAVQDDRIVVTKDSDFVQSFLLSGQPLLLLVSTGNIANAELEKLVRTNFPDIEAAFKSSQFVEITRNSLVIHR